MSSSVVSARRPRATSKSSATPQASAFDGRFFGVLVCFFLSGLAGLLYETAWTRQFAFVFGTSELAVVTVLAGYFGGLTLGAAIAGRWATRVRRPILTYGLLELGIGLAAIGMPYAIEASTRVYVAVFGGRPDSLETGGLVTAIFYLLCSFAILLVPTAMMGATLPLLARYAVTRERQIGPRVGLLYAVNTIGAVAGTVIAAFALLPALGLLRTIWVGVFVNLLVFLAALLLSRASVAAEPDSGHEETSDSKRAASEGIAGTRVRWILPMMLVSGAASFSYEVIWTRLLGHVLGASVFAFSTMLASFLAGIAFGAAIASRFSRRREGTVSLFAIVQFGICIAALLSYALMERLPDWARSIGAGVSAGLLANAAVCALILLPGAVFIGATFPFAVRILARESLDAGPVSARVYAWNTIGAIIGSVLCGFVLLPMLEFGGALAVTAAVNVLLGAAVVLLATPVRKGFVGVGILGALAVILARPSEPWAVLRNSALGRRPAGGELTYYAVGRSSTVLLIDDGVGWDLRTSGLPEANIRRRGVSAGRALIQQWQNALPVLARPKAKTLMFVGLGGGVATELVPARIERIDVVELEPEVIEANRAVAGLREVDPLADPRVRLFTNDARNALLLSETQYDAIVSQPSHPWTAGASHLYTREFMAMVRDRLSADGVLLQWMSLAFVDEALLRSLVATLTDVFGYVEMYAPYPGAVLFLASREPVQAWEGSQTALAEETGEFGHAGVVCAEDVLAALELDSAAARGFGEGAPCITDDFNLLQLRSRRVEDEVRSSWKITDAALAEDDPAVGWVELGDAVYLVRKLMTRGNAPRALRLADSIRDAATRANCMGHIRDWEGKTAAAIGHFREAMKLQPDSQTALFGFVRLQAAELFRRHPQITEVAARLSDPAKAVIEGWQFASARQVDAVRGLDKRLSAAAATDDWYVDAQRLRARWRVQTKDPELCREAERILDAFIPRFGSADDLLMRAEASIAAGNEAGGLAALHEAAQMIRPDARGRAMGEEIVKKLGELGPAYRASEAAQRLSAMLSQTVGVRATLPSLQP